MRRMLSILTFAILLAWVSAAIGVGGTPPARAPRSAPASESAPSPGPAPVAEPLRRAAHRALERPSTTALPEPDRDPPAAEPNAMADPAEELERSFASEFLDPEWARDQEQRLGAAIEQSALREQLVHVTCQQSICRVDMEGDPRLLEQLLRDQGLRERMGLGPDAAHVLRAGQLSIYVQP